MAKNKIDKATLRQRIQELDIDNELKSQLLDAVSEKKTFGLVWEEKEEAAQELLREKLPVFVEDESKRITDGGKDAPNHVIIEGDNLHALTALAYTHEGKFDAIYIDPPYNSGARDWKYNNDYVDKEDEYRHSKWLDMMKHRLDIAKRLLNHENSVLIVTIDEKEYLHLGCLLEEMFPQAKQQMVSTVINPAGVARENQFSRSDEYIFFVQMGNCAPLELPLEDEWFIKADKQFKSLYWRSLSRAGSNDSRQHSPGCFYPIFVYENGKSIHSVGEALPLDIDRNEVIAPSGTVTIWPVHMDGSEGCWMQAPKNLRNLISKGYVRLGNFTDRGMAIKYLNKKEIEKVENGLFPIIGNREDGSIITEETEATRNVLPTTQWRISSHNARSGGTEVLKDILGPKSFSYPKSIFAVHDTLMFYIRNNRNAKILDFFAGSGTTMHATMMLNREDGGHRQCFLVSNDENNICEEVTYERNKRIINGYTTQKGAEVEGLHNNNLRFYRTNFVPRDLSATGQKNLMLASTDILCIKNDLYEEQEMFGSIKLRKHIARYFDDTQGKKMLIIYKVEAIESLVEEIAKMPEDTKIKVYVFSTNNYAMDIDFEEVADKVELFAMPAALWNAYRKVLPEKLNTIKEEENV